MDIPRIKCTFAFPENWNASIPPVSTHSLHPYRSRKRLVARISSDELPIISSNSPTSQTRCISTPVNDKSNRGLRVKLTVRVSPRVRTIFSNRTNSFAGRTTEATQSRKYTCTTSAPERDPVFVTVIENCTSSSTATSDCSKTISP